MQVRESAGLVTEECEVKRLTHTHFIFHFAFCSRCRGNLLRFLELCAKFSGSGNKNVKLAVCSLVANVCLCLKDAGGNGTGVEGGSSAKVVEKALYVMNVVVGAGGVEADGAKRLLCGVGTLFMMNGVDGLDVGKCVESAKEVLKGVGGETGGGGGGGGEIGEVVAEVKSLF